MVEVTVTQADRDAAADYLVLQFKPKHAAMIRKGDMDGSFLVQAFARHRAPDAEPMAMVDPLRDRKAVNTILARLLAPLIPDLGEMIEVGNRACTEIIKHFTHPAEPVAQAVVEADWRGVALKLHQALAQHTAEGCPRCPGDCSSANPPMYNCPTEAAIEAYRAFDAALAAMGERS